MTNGSQFTAAFREFFAAARMDEFLIFVDPERPSHFVQYKLSNGVLYGEVGSRQWRADPEDRPLTDAAELGLMRLGFTHGGPERNYCQDNLPADAPFLAQLTDQLFATAYELPAPTRPIITTDCEQLETWATRRGQSEPVGDPIMPPGTKCPCGYDHDDEPPLETSPGLAARALRAMHSNFMRLHLHCEDRLRFRAAVEAVRTFEELPDWAQDYILKAEEGPLW